MTEKDERTLQGVGDDLPQHGIMQQQDTGFEPEVPNRALARIFVQSYCQPVDAMKVIRQDGF